MRVMMLTKKNLCLRSSNYNDKANLFPKMIYRKIIAGGHWREIKDLTVNDGLAEIDRIEHKISFEDPKEKIVLNFPPVKVKFEG